MHCVEKSGGNTTRRVTGLDSDLSPRGRKLPTASENLTSRSLDTFPSTLSNSKAQEIIDGEHITSNILALSIEILSQIFNNGNGSISCFTCCFALFSHSFIPDQLRSIFSSPEIQFSNCLETIVIHSSSSRVHKEAGFLLCDFGRHTCNSNCFKNCHEFAPTHDICQYWMRRRPKRCPLSQSQDICKHCVPFLQPAIWVCAREFSISCCLMSSRLVCCFQISSKHPRGIQLSCSMLFSQAPQETWCVASEFRTCWRILVKDRGI